MNMVTRGRGGVVKQNVTTDRGMGSLVDRGDKSDNEVMWKDITLDRGNLNLLFTFTAWNKGNKDPQKVGIEIAQLVLKTLRGNLAVSVIVTAISLVLDQFKDAYDCHGPVMLNALPYSSRDLQNMIVGQSYCMTQPFNYQTQGGCIDGKPFNLVPKISRYVAETCIKRSQGSSTMSGEINVNRPGSAGKRLGPPDHLFGLETGTMWMLMWLNIL